MEGALDDVAKQLDKQVLEEKDKDDDDEGKCHFILSLDSSSVNRLLDSDWTNLQSPVVYICVFLVCVGLYGFCYSWAVRRPSINA